mmetsp:Transcript_10531/g.15713  ORF Transcript_10531/g.15713 Transcript_10531/m.15713 type:complete len:228 (-) Transcript_10531:197-880(-)|eukprot:CAMPEP_0113937100 /NCGR_PEP_ID=MMETSP1339-20121228/3806_1 /TAXON_ID=94617 /ORGANISM="Fibrocapsa japonica" /LENGTH=227 /DNA_ID=CAMNT_0000939749 /DNA_START=448 /DNA_END=1131 /DNA_ORIENTATION=+ /assembly_acc=CAM_ASM_000762
MARIRTNCAFIESYLFNYNVFMFCGWGLVAYLLVRATVPSFNENGLSPTTFQDGVRGCLTGVCILQLVALLEVVHAFLGLVRSEPFAALAQTLGRNFFLFLFCSSLEVVQQHPAALATLAAWALSELIRYPFYAATLWTGTFGGKCPVVLKWLRYSGFVLLYPIGFLGEAASLWVGAPVIASEGLYTPFDFRFILYPYMALAYIVVAPGLYFYMFKQRAKQMKKKKA